MGLLPAQALATTVITDTRFNWDVPETWTLEQAATVPVVYTTAYYALVVRGRIRRGEKILIHSGSGGVGQAAISVALAHGCEVFTTVGSEEKKKIQMAKFQQLKEDHFSNRSNDRIRIPYQESYERTRRRFSFEFIVRRQTSSVGTMFSSTRTIFGNWKIRLVKQFQLGLGSFLEKCHLSRNPFGFVVRRKQRRMASSGQFVIRRNRFRRCSTVDGHSFQHGFDRRSVSFYGSR